MELIVILAIQAATLGYMGFILYRPHARLFKPSTWGKDYQPKYDDWRAMSSKGGE